MRTIRNIRKIVLSALVIAVLLPLSLKGQQDIGFTQYTNNPISVNPAYAGSQIDMINFMLLSRHQWVGFEGAPTTQSFTIHGSLDDFNMGIGISFLRDQIGPINTNNISFDYAYRIKVHEGGILSMGLKAGLDMRKNSLTDLNPLDEFDSWYNQDIEGKTAYQFGVGLYYYTKKYYLGMSVPKLRNVYYDDDNPNLSGYRSQQERHYYMIGGYIWDYNDSWNIKPSFMARSVPDSPLSLDLNISAMYREMVVAGVTHRIRDSFAFIMQFNAFDNLWVGYAYDLTVSPLRSHNSGTHEILFSFDVLRSGEAIRSPRFF